MQKRGEKKIEMKLKLILANFIFFSSLTLSHTVLGLTDLDVQRWQGLLTDKPIGERIAFWGEKFMGTPYDKDPFGRICSKLPLWWMKESIACI